ncbi:MAG: hypothetical protein CM15mV3_2950 [Caudoviricetes sp.]|nr:MAG: hypothetical protein CM15mV3_2950 [Caudoviricetes sp.]
MVILCGLVFLTVLKVMILKKQNHVVKSNTLVLSLLSVWVWSFSGDFPAQPERKYTVPVNYTEDNLPFDSAKDNITRIFCYLNTTNEVEAFGNDGTHRHCELQCPTTYIPSEHITYVYPSSEFGVYYFYPSQSTKKARSIHSTIPCTRVSN